MKHQTLSRRRLSKGLAGFTMIEMIVVIAIMSILVGAAIPVTEKVIAYKARKATREELDFLSQASAAYFRDTNALPASIADLIVNPGKTGWTGPYISGVMTDQITGLTSYQVDAWSRAYVVKATGDVLTITSGGEDLAIGGEDIAVTLDVTWIRREKTLEQLKTINQAVTLYNGQYQSTAPLSAKWSTALDTLVSKGFLPSTAGYDKDAWGDAFIGDPDGKSPLVKVTSKTLSRVATTSSGGSTSTGSGSDKTNNGNHYGQEKNAKK